MRTRLPLAATLAAALLAAAPRPAAAQRAVAPNARPTAAADDAAAARPIANYRFTGSARAAGLPTQVSLADSGGVLVASLRLPGGAARPMLIEILETDLVLQGETPSGVLTLRLFGQNAALPGRAFSGHWWLGAREGELQGRSER